MIKIVIIKGQNKPSETSTTTRNYWKETTNDTRRGISRIERFQGGKMIKVKYSALIELECEVTNWAEMPKYKGRDVGND